ncbi:MFS transporter [Demequina pelophila]|uniref:MFS transporter n=1 Tax=Demequina pelophila TaxID=1638984 RepID=UPI000784367A|nr:MFS transporter [Demequina pelophila]
MSQLDQAPPPAAVAAPERPRVSKGTVASFMSAYMGAYLILIVPLVTTLAIRVDEIAPDNREASLGIIMGIGAMCAMVSNPIIGSLSDRTTSRYGRRRPWVVAGVLGGMLSVLVMAFGPSIVLVGLGWVLTQITMNAVLAALAAFIPDRVPEEQRGKVSALAGIAQQVTPLVGLAIANIALALGGGTVGMFLAPAFIGLVMVMIYAIRVDDPAMSAAGREPFRVLDIFKAFLFNPRQHPDFGWAWLGRFVMTLSYASLMTYQVYFINARFGIPIAEVVTIQLAIMVMTATLLALSASVAGSLSDRFKRRKAFVFFASALIAVGHVVTAFSFSLPMFWVASAIGAIAMGAYYAVDLALITDVLPDKEGSAGKNMGIVNIANALPQSLAPALAPFALAIGGGDANYTALFLIAAVIGVLGALTVIPIKGVR